MRYGRFSFFLLLALTVSAGVRGQDRVYADLGRTPTAEEIQAWDIAIGPEGKELPRGSGTASGGEKIFAQRCAACHGQDLEGGQGPALIGGQGTLGTLDPEKTIGSYWPFATMIWDYINRAMPRELEKIAAIDLGYSARWHVVRFPVYGLDWDITGLHLVPQNPLPDMPTLVIIHGGSSNWYEFFVDPLNNPGLGQYLAQKIPVLLVTIPGNYRPGGWTQELGQRVPPYVLDRDIPPGELKIRNAAFTFRLQAEGVTRLVKQITTGPVVISGHSTSGELSYMLEDPKYLRDRTQGRLLIWEGGSHAGTRAMQQERGVPDRNDWPAITELRTRPPATDYTGEYLGPLNPVYDPAKSRLQMAERWMGDLEFRRRAHFKQPLQDLERRGGYPALRESVTQEVRQTLAGNELGVDAEQVVADLFAPMRAPLTGYRAILRAVAGDEKAGRLNDETLANDSTLQMLNELRQHNPGAEVRMLIFDVPMTHYGHIERPRQLAGGLLAALRWLMQQ